MYAKLLQPARPPAAQTGAATADLDLLRLLALREIEASGPMTGLEALNRIAPTARLLGLGTPGYPLLHDMTDRALLESVAGRPPRYRITEDGSREAERLARLHWPRLQSEVVRLSSRLAPASPWSTRAAFSLTSEGIGQPRGSTRARGH
jgi:DNA-binding PadR family transcriptional regulator